MSSKTRPQQRRRAVLSCVECRKRKQKCSRGHPCTQCVARGPESVYRYEPYNNRQFSPASNMGSSLSGSLGGSSTSNLSLPSETPTHLEKPDASALHRHAHEYGYSTSDSLNSMGILAKVVTDIIGTDVSLSHPAVTSHIQSRIRAEYFGFVRRIPSKALCEILFQHFFARGNQFHGALDETIFREQFERWWDLAHGILLKHGPENLPKELQCFPSLLFQVLAISLQLLPSSYDPGLDELKFGPLQTFDDLSREYTECGVDLSKLLGRARTTLVGVQHSYMRDYWLINSGDLMQAWNYSGETVKDAMAIGLHLEPELSTSSQPEELLDAIWIDELRKRTWLNIFVWDSAMPWHWGSR